MQPSNEDRIIIGFCRVPFGKSKHKLKEQIEFMESHLKMYGKPFEIITGIAYGSKRDRKAGDLLSERVVNHEISTIFYYHEHRSRLTDFTYKRLSKKLAKYGTKAEAVYSKKKRVKTC